MAASEPVAPIAPAKTPAAPRPSPAEIEAAAKLIADQPVRPRRTLRVALFGAEEIGKAADAYASTHLAEQDRHIIAAECDFGGEPVYRIELPEKVAASPFGRALASVVSRVPTPVVATPVQDGGADLESLKGVPRAGLAQDGTHYFDLHHTVADTLDKVSAQSLDKAVATWVAFAYLAADTDVDFRAISKGPPTGK